MEDHIGSHLNMFAAWHPDVREMEGANRDTDDVDLTIDGLGPEK